MFTRSDKLSKEERKELEDRKRKKALFEDFTNEVMKMKGSAGGAKKLLFEKVIFSDQMKGFKALEETVQRIIDAAAPFDGKNSSLVEAKEVYGYIAEVRLNVEAYRKQLSEIDESIKVDEAKFDEEIYSAMDRILDVDYVVRSDVLLDGHGNISSIGSSNSKEFFETVLNRGEQVGFAFLLTDALKIRNNVCLGLGLEVLRTQPSAEGGRKVLNRYENFKKMFLGDANLQEEIRKFREDVKKRMVAEYKEKRKEFLSGFDPEDIENEIKGNLKIIEIEIDEISKNGLMSAERLAFIMEEVGKLEKNTETLKFNWWMCAALTILSLGILGMRYYTEYHGKQEAVQDDTKKLKDLLVEAAKDAGVKLVEKEGGMYDAVRLKIENVEPAKIESKEDRDNKEKRILEIEKKAKDLGLKIVPPSIAEEKKPKI